MKVKIWEYGLAAVWLVLAVLAATLPAPAAQLLPQGQQQFFGNDGKPLIGGQVYFYVPSTTTPKNTWSDPAGTTPNTNPVVLDGYGRASIYGTGQYRQILKTSAGVTIWDKVVSDYSNTSVFYGGTAGGTPNALTLTAPGYTQTGGQLVFLVATATNTGATSLNINGLGAKTVVQDSATGPTALVGGEIVAGNTVGVLYDSVAGVLHLTGVPVGTLPSLTVTGTLTVNTIATTSLTVNGVSLNPSGEVAVFARNTCPSGWLEAAGTEVSRTTYANLYGAIGTAFGTGNGATTFNLPDLRGYFVRGWDHGRGIDTSRAFASNQADRIAPHYHYMWNTTVGTYPADNDTTVTASNYSNVAMDHTDTDARPGYYSYLMTGTSTLPTIGRTSSNPSGVATTETMPKNVAMLYCVRY